jgi:hypothetical protein
VIDAISLVINGVAAGLIGTLTAGFCLFVGGLMLNQWSGS